MKSPLVLCFLLAATSAVIDGIHGMTTQEPEPGEHKDKFNVQHSLLSP